MPSVRLRAQAARCRKVPAHTQDTRHRLPGATITLTVTSPMWLTLSRAIRVFVENWWRTAASVAPGLLAWLLQVSGMVAALTKHGPHL